MALGAVPLWMWLRGDRSSLAVRSAPVLAILACAAVVCSLSPERTIGPLTLVRPSALLYEVAPMFRAYSRFGVVVGLMAALLAGAGAAHLWRSSATAGRRAASLVLLALAVARNGPSPPWRWRDVLPTRAHRWLASARRAARPGLRAAGASVRRSPSHCSATTGRCSAGPVDDCGEPRLAEKLAGMGYTHVVLRPDSRVGTMAGAP